MGTFFLTMGVYIWGVVPILPALPAILVILPIIAVSIVLAIGSLFRPATLARLTRMAWRQRWALLIASGCFVGLWWTLNRIGVGRGNSDERSTSAGADWPMYRGGLRRTGSVAHPVKTSDIKLPTKPGLVWSYQRRGEAFYSSPAVVGGRVYIVGSQGDRGRIYCLDANAGDVLWSLSPPGYRATFSSPVIAGSWLVCGEGLHHAREARVICVDLRKEHEGELAWSFTTRGHVECTPVIANGRVYFGAGDDGIYCLDLKAPDHGKPRVIWHAPGKDFPDAETSLVVHENRVYAGLGLNGNALCVLDADTGKQLQRFDFEFPLFSPPSIDDGKLYVGMGVGDYVTPNENPVGQVCCIDLSAMKLDWTFPIGGTVLGAVAADESGIVFSCADGQVYRVDKHGTEVARRATHSPIISSPAIAEQLVAVVNNAGVLYALDRNSLDVLWEQRLGELGRFISSPAIAHGHVYVGTEVDGFLCVGRSSGSRKVTQWPGELGGGGLAGCRDGSAVPSPAELAWQFPADNADSFIVTAPLAPVDDGVLVPVASGELAGIVHLRDSVTAGPAIKWHLPFTGGVWSSPTLANDKVFFVAGNRGDDERALYGVAIDDPQHQWSIPIDKAAAGILLADEHSIIVQNERNVLSAFNHDGDVIWKKQVGRIEQLVTGNAAVVLAAIEEPPLLALLDRPTGEYLWRIQLDDRPRTAPIINGNSIVIGTDNGLELRRIENGRLVAHSNAAAGGVRSPIFVNSSVCLFVSNENQLVAAHSSDLLTIAVHELGEHTIQNFLLTPRMGLIERDGQIRRFVRITDSFLDKQWLDTTEYGNITSPLVLQGGRLYFATSKRGVVCIARGTPE